MKKPLPPYVFQKPIRDPEVIRRVQRTFELHQMALDMVRQNTLRKNPDATEEEIRQAIRDWLKPSPEADYDRDVFRPRKKPIPSR